VGGQVGVVGIAQVGQSRRPLDAKRDPCGGAQSGAGQYSCLIREADEPRFEGRIPESGEQQAIVHIEPLRIVTFGPGHNVGGAQQGVTT